MMIQSPSQQLIHPYLPAAIQVTITQPEPGRFGSFGIGALAILSTQGSDDEEEEY